MRSKRLLLLLVMAAGAIFVAVEVARHMREQALQDPRELLEFTPGVPLQVKNFHRSMIRDGRKAWEIKGAEATYFKAEERAAVSRPRLVFYRNNGGTLEARGREGNVFLPNGQLQRAVLDGAVDVVYQEARFRTDKLIYLHADDRIVCPGRVWAVVDGVEFEGENMTYSLADDTIELRGAVRTTIHARLPGQSRMTNGL
ncbi:MAG: LPS export ABC transporter periplasmic protein LptC [Deltaproteobacteria bacterium]|nr:LPS export ABC transporter periplasmic protein LptC [Deltaproteobacteria bacterium]